MYLLYFVTKFTLNTIIDFYFIDSNETFALEFLQFKMDNLLVLEQVIEFDYETDLNLSIITSKTINGSPQEYPKTRIYFFFYKYYYFVPKD